LLVAKDKETLALLEVGDAAKKKYLAQATKANTAFLMQAIKKSNDCDLNYRASKNQRLLVELTLMQIASITFDGEKKKPGNYIIPATFFQALSPARKVVSKPIEKKIITSPPKEEIIRKPRLEKATRTSTERRTSSLSLKSIHLKKEDQKTAVEVNYDNHPKEEFTEKSLQQHWKNYTDLLNKKGERSMASIIGAGIPQLKDQFKISYTVPNKLMADQFRKGKPKLLKFLREKLNNYGIEIQLTLNEAVEKKFAYTPQEKYHKLKEMNPLLEKLRQTFELDL
jgi:DNA polymerase-3 subunit gamma/tau